MRSFYLALVLLVFTTACTKVTSIRYNPGYNNVLSKHQEVIILPPAAEVNTVDIGGKKKRVYNYEANLEQLIAAETNTDLQELGFNVKVMHRKDFHDLGIYDHYLRLRDTYDTARRELYQPLLWEESKAFAIANRLGESAIIVGKKTKSDIIIMVDYAGMVKTNGARALDLTLTLLTGHDNSSNNAESSLMIIGIIDAKTGNILWTNMSVDNKDLFSSAINNFSSQNNIDVKRLNKLIENIFKPLKKDLA